MPPGTRRTPPQAILSLLLCLAAALVVSTACERNSAGFPPGQTDSSGYNGPVTHQKYGGAYQGGTATGDTEAGAAFARWVLEQDPERQYLTDAVVRDESDLGVKVQPTVTKGELRDLLSALGAGMARTFPGKPITVTAFYQSGDKLAEARVDPRSGNIEFR
jgi:hypothetical protein